jgi:kinesin family protein 2/24
MGGDSGDAVMARWLQSAGLQHLAAASSAGAGGAADYRGGMPAGLGGAGAGSMLSSLLMQVRFLCPPSLSGDECVI